MSDNVQTDVYPAPEASWAPATDPALPASPAEDDLWPVRTVSRGLRLRIPTAVLLALLVAGGAFWGGAALEKSHGGSTSAFSSLASRFRGLGGTTGGTGSKATGSTGTTGRSGFFGGASTAAATGTVTVVEGNTLYVTSASGSIVKVVLGAKTTVTRDATATASALKPGDTVIVQGAKNSDGAVSATSVSATAAGVSATSGFGGFAG